MMPFESSKFEEKAWKYARLEGSSREENFGRNLRSEIRDGLWMLCRQWQMGEFIGEDVGTPHKVQIEAVCQPLAGNPAQSGQPLEPFVEGEAPTDNLFTRIQAGQYFQSLLSANGLEEVLGAFLGRYSLAQMETRAPKLLESLLAQPAAFQLYYPLRFKQLDGLQILMDSELKNGVSILEEWVAETWGEPGGANKILDCVAQLEAWRRRRYPASPSWKTHSLDYSYTMGSEAHPPANVQHFTFTADNYPGGKLDWYDFDLKNAGSLSSTGKTYAFLPMPCTFRGMPASRWWEMEDSSVNLHHVEVGKTGILDLLFLEFALLYGNDWFLIPFSMPVGHVCEIKQVWVTDVFGDRPQIQSAKTGTGKGRFALFEHTRPANASSAENIFCLFPVVDNILEGRPLEQVHFFRDEMANLAWAVESIVPGQLGEGLKGAQASSSFQEEENLAGSGTMYYTLANKVPDHWIPFIPVNFKQGAYKEIRLQQARMPQGANPRGIILNENTTPVFIEKNNSKKQLEGYFILEEEITQLGTAVARSYQRTRGPRGEIYTWAGRKKGTGKGEGGSGLMFDQLFHASKEETQIRSTLHSGESLKKDEFIQSANGEYTLVMQQDGNLVLYEHGVEPLWASHTGKGEVCVMQEDGDLVVSDAEGKPAWSSGTGGHPGAFLTLNNDKNLVITDRYYRPIWNSENLNLSFLLAPGAQLNMNESLLSANSQYRLIMQRDGDLVLFGPDEIPLWAAGTPGSGANLCIMQRDGNLVLYTAGGVPVWATGTDGQTGAFLVLHSDGYLTLYDSGNNPIWSIRG